MFFFKMNAYKLFGMVGSRAVSRTFILRSENTLHFIPSILCPTRTCRFCAPSLPPGYCAFDIGSPMVLCQGVACGSSENRTILFGHSCSLAEQRIYSVKCRTVNPLRQTNN